MGTDDLIQDLLELDKTRLDQRIAADLAAELETLLAEKIDSVPELRRFLAIKGYRELRARLELEVGGKTGTDAVRALAIGLRAFAHDRPGLSAATFRTPVTDTPEWRRAGEALGGVVLCVFAGVGLTGEAAQHAMRILRALVRGFVLHEISASFLEPLDYDKSYDLAVELFIRGLSVLQDGNQS